jgi:hypothetical protein
MKATSADLILPKVPNISSKCSLLTVRVSPPTNNLALFAGELLLDRDLDLSLLRDLLRDRLERLELEREREYVLLERELRERERDLEREDLDFERDSTESSKGFSYCLYCPLFLESAMILYAELLVAIIDNL